MHGHSHRVKELIDGTVGHRESEIYINGNDVMQGGKRIGAFTPNMAPSESALSDVEKENMRILKDVAAGLMRSIDQCGDSRELSIARTKLEECVMWAVKHITK